MSRPQQLSVQNSGSKLKWVIQIPSFRPSMLPVKPKEYLLGLKYLVIHQHVETHSTMGHVCIDTPSINSPTYLLNGNPVDAVKSYEIEKRGRYILRDYSDNMEFFRVSFASASWMNVYIVDNDGKTVQQDATLVFELYDL